MTTRPRAWLSSFLLVGGLGVGVLGCGGTTAKQLGEECVASSECADGLVCDFGRDPHVCASNVSVDAAAIDADDTIDAAELDAATIDGRTIDAATIDARVIDAAVIDAPPIDAATPIDAPTDAETDAPAVPPDA